MTLSARRFLANSFWLRMFFAWSIVCLAMPQAAFAANTVQGTDGTSGYSGDALLDATTSKTFCSQSARGASLTFAGGVTVSLDPCSSSTLSTTDIVPAATTSVPGVATTPVVVLPNATKTLSGTQTFSATDIGQSATATSIVPLTNGDGNLNAFNSQGGLNWIQRKSVADVAWTSVVRAPTLGLWVAVSPTLGGPHVMTSPDGIDWTARTAPDQNWNGVTVGYPGGVETLVAVGYSGHFNRVMYSTNGTSWTNGSLSADYNYAQVRWTGTQFVALTNNGGTNSIATSTNGSSWSVITTPNSDVAWQAIETDGAGKVVAVGFTGTAGHVMVSTDSGATWAQNAGLDARSWNGVGWSAKLSQWVAVSNGGGPDDKRIGYSSDAVTWAQILPPSLMAFGRVIYGDQWVATAGASGQERVATSPDGKVWRLSQPATQAGWSDIGWAQNQYVAVAVGGTGNRVMTAGSLLPATSTAMPPPLYTLTSAGTVTGTGSKTLAITRSTYTATWVNVQSVTFTATGTGTGTGTTTTTGTITGSAYGTAASGGTFTGTVTVTATGTGSGTSTATVPHFSVGNASSAPALLSEGSSSQAKFDDAGNMSTTGTIKADTGLASRTSAEFGGSQGAAISMIHDSYASEIGFNLSTTPSGFAYGPGSSGQYAGYMQFGSLTGQWVWASSQQASNAGVNWQQYPATSKALLTIDKSGNGTFAGNLAAANITPTPTPTVIPVSSGLGDLNAWVTSLAPGALPVPYYSNGTNASIGCATCFASKFQVGSGGQFTIDGTGNVVTTGILYTTGSPIVPGWPIISIGTPGTTDLAAFQVANDSGYTAGIFQAFGSLATSNTFPSAVGASTDAAKLVLTGQGNTARFHEFQIGAGSPVAVGFFTNGVERAFFGAAGGFDMLTAIKMHGSSTGIVTIQPAASAGTWAMTLPTTPGTAGQVLQTDGAGVTSWVNPTGTSSSTNTFVFTNATKVSGANGLVTATASLSSSDVTNALTYTPMNSTVVHLTGDVPTSRRINTIPLSGDITLTAANVGAMAAPTLTTGYVPRATSANTLGDSVIYNSGSGQVGIGTNTPGAKATVNGGHNVVQIGEQSNGSYTGAVGFSSASLTSSNYALSGDSTRTYLNAPSDSLYICIGGTPFMTADSTGKTSWTADATVAGKVQGQYVYSSGNVDANGSVNAGGNVAATGSVSGYNITPTPGSAMIPKADGNGKLDAWVTHNVLSSEGPSIQTVVIAGTTNTFLSVSTAVEAAPFSIVATVNIGVTVYPTAQCIVYLYLDGVALGNPIRATGNGAGNQIIPMSLTKMRRNVAATAHTIDAILFASGSTCIANAQSATLTVQDVPY